MKLSAAQVVTLSMYNDDYNRSEKHVLVQDFGEVLGWVAVEIADLTGGFSAAGSPLKFRRIITNNGTQLDPRNL